MRGDKQLFARIESLWAAMAARLVCRDGGLLAGEVEQAARRLAELAVFAAMCRRRGLVAACATAGLSSSGRSTAPVASQIEADTSCATAGLSSSARSTVGQANRGTRQLELGVPLVEVPGGTRQLELGVPLVEVPGGNGEQADARLLPAAVMDVGVLCPLLEESFSEAAEIAGQPPDWLGRLHEHLLGRRLVPGGDGRFRVVSDRASRKSSGVYYTPDCVVRYIVERSLGGWLEERASALPGCRPAVIDPACGSGAFLTAACRLLLERFRHNPGGDGFRLLTEGLWLYGMDLDPDAVLAARRSLWLTLFDAAGAEAAAAVAPHLAAMIRCGDALADAAEDELGGRFDVVLGNPPYRRELGAKRLLERLAATRLGRRYHRPRMDLAYYFLHRGLELLKPGGRMSMIVGSYWTAGAGSNKLLDVLRREAQIEEIFLLDRTRVFEGVAGRHMILTLRKGAAAGPTTIKTAPPSWRHGAEPLLQGRSPAIVFQKTQEQLFRSGRIDLEPPADGLLEKLARGEPLGRFGLVRQGIVENPATVTAAANRRHGGCWRTGEGVFALKAEELAGLGLCDAEMELVRPYHDLCDLGRHFLAERPSLRLVYLTPATCPDIERFPRLRRHLERFRPLLEARRETRLGRRPWWQLHWPREERLWRSSKVIAVQMARRPAAAAAEEPAYVPFSANVFVPAEGTREHVGYFAAVLASRLIWEWCRHFAKRRGVGLEINVHLLREAPVRRVDFSSAGDRRRHDELVELAREQMRLRREIRRSAERGPAARLEEQIASTDERIDRLVCELYGLSDAEAAAVCGGEWDSR